MKVTFNETVYKDKKLSNIT